MAHPHPFGQAPHPLQPQHPHPHSYHPSSPLPPLPPPPPPPPSLMPHQHPFQPLQPLQPLPPQGMPTHVQQPHTYQRDLDHQQPYHDHAEPAGHDGYLSSNSNSSSFNSYQSYNSYNSYQSYNSYNPYKPNEPDQSDPNDLHMDPSHPVHNEDNDGDDDEEDDDDDNETVHTNNETDEIQSLDGTKQTSPAPANENSKGTKAKNSKSKGQPSNGTSAQGRRGSTKTTPSKGKIFQCTGFGDCRMVFTRSEHLARHARKHTGEKPFQCVVDGCTRMFSRFDNMVQHTQTHTKGPNAESSEGIATKIAIESQRKSEAGLFSRSGRRLSVKGGGISKRGSVSSASGSEAPRISRRDRLQSLPGLAMTPSDCSLPSPTSIPPSPVKITKRRQQSRARQGDRRKSLSLNLTAAREMRRESISHPPTATAESWYASKLHHRPSIDFGMLAFGNNNNNSDLNRLERFPPVGHFSDTSNLQQSSPSPFAWARHPLSPEHSSHSDDGDSDGASPYTRTLESDRLSPWTGSHVNSSTSSLNRPMIDDDQSMDVVKMEECTLPPLRSIPFGASAEGPQQTRLPSIVQTRYRSQSVFHPLSQGPPDFGGPEAFMASRSTRRLSLVDLNAPIQDATRAVHNSMMNQMQPSGQNRVLSGPVEAQDNTAAKMEGVDVSMDEMQALEAFGELWSQGRAVEPAANPTTSAPLTATTTVVKEQRLNRPRSMTPVNVNDEYLSSAPPGPDFGRRVGGPVFSDENNGHVPSHGRGRYDSMTDSRMPTGMMDIQ